ncbi:hypothetical protein F5X68DRAFT_77980 [Plectosphaerella plurivora]|uniref:Uncharacterized protein n=1 Tax=Plectosphaerella plurivora TaxID=936078 RepID=A0A9P8VCX9_9PEZI|nr:hypothetical protein F5X68DRAFT_77980 [Plectosphaerella plurivora]
MSDSQLQEAVLAQVDTESGPAASSPAPIPDNAAAAAPAVAEAGNEKPDILMADAPANGDEASPAVAAESPAPAVQSPAPVAQPLPSAVASPAPARTGTPVRTNGALDKEPGSSRANSVLPEQREPLPDRAAAHGEPARKYLNTKVSEHLLEGMKKLAKEQPNDPLRVLGEFLISRHQELENAGNI